MFSTVQDWSNITDRESISKYLPFRDFETNTGIFATNDDGFGILVECSPLMGVDKNVESAISSALSILPDNTAIQIMLLASPNVTGIVDNWHIQKQRAFDDPLCHDIAYSYKQFLESKIKSQISNNFRAPIRNFRLLISIKVGGKDNKPTLLSKLMSFDFKALFTKDKDGTEKFDKSELFKKYSELIQAKDQFIGSLQQAYLNPRLVDADKAIAFYYEILNMNHDLRDIPKWDGSDINNFIFANDNKIVQKENELIVDELHVKTLSVREYPEELGIFDVIRYAGDAINNQNHASPFLITLNVVKLGEKAKSEITRRAALTSSQQMPYNLFPKLKYIHRDLNFAMDAMQKGAAPYYISFQIAIFGNTTEELNNLAGQFKSYFKTLTFAMEEDKYILFPALLTMLPFGFDMEIQKFLSEKRGRVVFSENAISMMPVSAEWLGTNPQVPMISPKGQLFGIDLFANKAGGFNAFVIGMTGSGKSVWMQWIALNYYLSGNKIWIIDIGGSYEKVCEVFNGQYLDFNENSKVILNPFTSMINREMLDEYIEFVSSLYLMMGLPKERQLSEQLEKLMKTYLLEAIYASYDEYGPNSDVDTIVEKLKIVAGDHDNDDRLIDFIKHLSIYQSNNMYGKFFNGKSNINFGNDFVVLECGSLENSPDLLNPILMVLTYQISKEIYLEEKNKSNHNRKNIVIMDEAHKFLGKSAHVEIFVEQAYRRFRKHGASMLLGTQGFEDLYGGDSVSKVGRVIIENSFWNFFLMQRSTSREKIKKSGFFNLSPYAYALMDNTAPADGEYGEIFIMTDRVQTKGRVVLDKFLQTLLFTDADLRSKMNKLVSQGMSHLDAVKHILEDKH